LRIVLDANVIISGAISPLGLNARVLDAWRGGSYELLLSEAMLREMDAAMRRPRLEQRGLHPDSVTSLIRELGLGAAMVDTGELTIDLARDSADNRILEAAVAGNADLIVTSDKDLLSLYEVEGVRIVTLQEFARTLGIEV